MNANPDPEKYITKLILTHLLKVKKNNLCSNLYLTLEISNFFRFRLEKYNFLGKNPNPHH